MLGLECHELARLSIALAGFGLVALLVRYLADNDPRREGGE